MKFIGVLILINVLAILAFLTHQNPADWKRYMGFATAGLFVGVALILSDRITGIKLSGIGEIKAQAMSDVEEIARIRDDLESQRDSVAMVVRDANKAWQRIEEVSKLSEQGAEHLRSIERIQSKATEALVAISELSMFSHVLISAQNDSRPAFDELRKIADAEGPFRPYAAVAIEQIALDVSPLFTVRIDPDVPWGTYRITPEKAALDELKQVYGRLRNPYKPRFITFLWGQNRLPKLERMDFLADIIQTDGSLRALEKACFLMNKEAKLNLNILGASRYLDWWRENRSKYESN
jgi:hypothetical protein